MLVLFGKHTIEYDNGKKETLNLGDWCRTQRDKRNKNSDDTFTNDELKKLNDVGLYGM